MKEWKDKFYVDIIKNERNSNGAEIKFLEVEDMEKVKNFTSPWIVMKGRL